MYQYYRLAFIHCVNTRCTHTYADFRMFLWPSNTCTWDFMSKREWSKLAKKEEKSWLTNEKIPRKKTISPNSWKRQKKEMSKDENLNRLMVFSSSDVFFHCCCLVYKATQLWQVVRRKESKIKAEKSHQMTNFSCICKFWHLARLREKSKKCGTGKAHFFPSLVFAVIFVLCSAVPPARTFQFREPFIVFLFVSSSISVSVYGFACHSTSSLYFSYCNHTTQLCSQYMQ